MIPLYVQLMAEGGLKMSSENQFRDKNGKRFLIACAWALMLLVSDLPDIFCTQFFSHVPKWLFWGKVGLLLLFLGLSLLYKTLRPLRQYAAFLAVFFLALAASAWIGNLPGWQRRFSGPEVSFTAGYVGFHLRDLAVAGAVIAVLWLMKRKRRNFFLVKGQLDAPIRPVRWLGIGVGNSWRTFGWIFTIAASLGVAIPTLLGLKLSGPILSRAVSLLPAVLLFAAVNAFAEEVYFRASFLSTLHEVIGRGHTLLISSVFFGMAHYLYGSPPGLPGFLMTGFLAWLLGKSMLETRGLGWPWLIHFVPDVVVFASYAILWVQR
jgi:membrane protease YdiL (CAAX protease family)